MIAICVLTSDDYSGVMLDLKEVRNALIFALIVQNLSMA
jgi:hypothetical protein